MWKKSTKSGMNGCVEVDTSGEMIHVRDSKDPGGPVLSFRPDEWSAFLGGVHAREFELPTAATKH